MEPRVIEPSDALRALLIVLDTLDCGVVLLSADRRLRYANRIAIDECARGATIVLRDGHVQAACRQEDGALDHAMRDAARGRRSLLTLGAFAVAGAGAGAGAGAEEALPMVVIPLSQLGADTSDAAGLTLLVLGRRSAGDHLGIEMFAHAHRLTGAETHVLHRLCEGMRPEEVARQSGVAMSTVRTQIMRVREKTSTASIRHLVQRIASLPPVRASFGGRVAPRIGVSPARAPELAGGG